MRSIRERQVQHIADMKVGLRAIFWSGMYHLLVSGTPDSWSGMPWTIDSKDLNRCLDEYTEAELTTRYKSLDLAAVNALRRFPAIFAYEQGLRIDPQFGMIRDIVRRTAGIRVEYELIPLDRFLTARELADAAFELDIAKLELNRTHWALKDVDLAKQLQAKGIALPSSVMKSRTSVDITTHTFDVALSFPGEVRHFVNAVAGEVERRLGADRCFYDDNYRSQLARPSLDILLQEVYGKRSQLIVVFLSNKYHQKYWCGIEFRVIREIINQRSHDRVMFVRMDDGEVEGIRPSDGYIDARIYSPIDVASFICERAELQSFKNANNE